MYKVKRFSIQSGRPNKSASLGRELANRAGIGAGAGAIVGGTLGTTHAVWNYAAGKAAEHAGLGGVGIGMSGKEALITAGVITAGVAAFGAIANALSAMGANKRRSKATKVNMNQVLDELDVTVRNFEKSTGDVEVNIFRYIETDKDPKDYHLTIAYEDGCAILLIRNPKHDLLTSLNGSLEDIIKFNRKADYTAEEAENGYVVYLTVPSVEAICGLIYNTIHECRVKINCLTEKKIKL